MNFQKRLEIFTRKHYLGREDGENHFMPVFGRDSDEISSGVLVTIVLPLFIVFIAAAVQLEDPTDEFIINWEVYFYLVLVSFITCFLHILKKIYSYTDWHDKNYTMQVKPLKIIDARTGREIGREGYMRAMFGETNER